MTKLHRIFCEWFDPARPNWGGYLNSTGGDFQQLLVEMVEQYGPPTKVEFRADDEGWAEPWVCPECSKGVVECHCDEVQCPSCSQWFSADPDPQGRCPVCVDPIKPAPWLADLIEDADKPGSPIILG